jgi:hypothetical protein
MSVTDAAHPHPAIDGRTFADAPVRIHPSGIPYAPAKMNWFARLITRVTPMPWAVPAAVAACFAGAASYVLVSNPTDAGANDISTCIVKLTTGLDCPGCGGTRAFYYLLNGNIPEAARHHAIAVFAAPFLVWLYVAWAVKRVTGKEIPTPTIGPKVLGVFLGAWAVWMVLRNLPFAPFTAFYV